MKLLHNKFYLLKPQEEKKMAKKRTDERNGENVDGEEPNFDDPEDFVDDVSDQGAYFIIHIYEYRKILHKN